MCEKFLAGVGFMPQDDTVRSQWRGLFATMWTHAFSGGG